MNQAISNPVEEVCLRAAWEIFYGEDDYLNAKQAGSLASWTGKALLLPVRPIADKIEKHLGGLPMPEPVGVEEPSPEQYLRLTKRQKQIFHAICQGMTSKEIAKALFLSFKTVETHRAQMMDRIGIKRTVHLVRYAAEHGLLDKTLEDNT